jgi:hypothetical protein
MSLVVSCRVVHLLFCTLLVLSFIVQHVLCEFLLAQHVVCDVSCCVMPCCASFVLHASKKKANKARTQSIMCQIHVWNAKKFRKKLQQNMQMYNVNAPMQELFEMVMATQMLFHTYGGNVFLKPHFLERKNPMSDANWCVRVVMGVVLQTLSNSKTILMQKNRK